MLVARLLSGGARRGGVGARQQRTHALCVEPDNLEAPAPCSRRASAVCDAGWSGVRCTEQQDSCQNGFLDADRQCAIGVADAGVRCCGSTRAARAARAARSTAVASAAARTASSTCWATAVRAALDAAGECCASSMDRCDVCDGDGRSCKVIVRLSGALAQDVAELAGPAPSAGASAVATKNIKLLVRAPCGWAAARTRRPRPYLRTCRTS